VTVSNDTQESGRHRFVGSCVAGSTSPELVYSFRVTRPQAVLFRTDSAFDGALFLRTACRQPDTELACNDDSGGTDHSFIGRFLQPGTYFLFVDGYDGSAGRFTLTTRVVSDCIDGDGEACEQIGQVYAEARGTPENCPAATEAYRLACQAGRAAGCNRLGLMSDSNGHCQTGASGTVALGHYSRACDMGFAIGCSNAARLYDFARGGMSRDEGRALVWYRRGCAAGDDDACGSVGVAMAVARDLNGALPLLRRGCNGGNVDACNRLGILHGQAGGPHRDGARVALEEACAGNIQTACGIVGMRLVDDNPTGFDPALAERYLTRACSEDEDGVRVTCRHLGRLYRDGPSGFRRDPVQAREFFRRGCQAEDASACNALGLLCGNGVPPDPDCARTAYESACTANMAEGCGNLGTLVDRAAEGPPNPARAVQLFQRACAGGFNRSCGDLARHLENGLGIARDPAQAMRFYQQACEALDFTACDDLGRIYADGLMATRDDARALTLFRGSCERNVGHACYAVGVFLRDARGGLQGDTANAGRFFTRACTLRFAPACRLSPPGAAVTLAPVAPAHPGAVSIP
jgi:TPR repeat protein